MNSAFEAWIDSLSMAWWDDATDACGFLESLQEAFEAGWAAAQAKYLAGVQEGLETP